MSDPPPTSRQHLRPPVSVRPSFEGLEGRALMSYGGSPAFSFGTDGELSGGLPTINEFFEPERSAVQPDGKIVAVGYVQTETSSNTDLLQAVVRYDADGSLDPDFGTNGVFTNPPINDPGASAVTSLATNLAIQPDGDLVVVGIDRRVANVFRLTPSGALDSTFGTGGFVTLGTQDSGDGKLDTPTGVAILADGQIAVGGVVNVISIAVDPAVELLDALGSVVTSFGTAGVAVAPVPFGSAGYLNPLTTPGTGSALAVSPDGSIAIAGDSVTDDDASKLAIAVTEFTPAGAIDASFAFGGQQIVAASQLEPYGGSLDVSRMLFQPDGKLVIGGSTQLVSTVDQDTSPQTTVIRLDANGALDSSFGIAGGDILVGRLSYDEHVSAMALQPDGKIVVSDSLKAAYSRFDADGLPDDTFGEGGTTLVLLPGDLGYQEGPVGVSIQPDGNIDAMTYGVGVFLIQLLGRGAQGDYNDAGVSDPAIQISPDPVFAAHFSGGIDQPGELVQFGMPGAGNTLPAPADYNGGGISELGVYLPTLGAFAYRPYNGSGDVITAIGAAGAGNSLPAPGDYDGVGQAGLAVYVPAVGEFVYQAQPGGITEAVPLGIAGAGRSIPVPGDYLGTGRDDFAVYEPIQGDFVIRNPANGTVATIPLGAVGVGNSIPAPGAYDVSGRADLAVYEPSVGQFMFQSAFGGPVMTVTMGPNLPANAIPAPGDYDGSGRDEFAIYEPTTGTLIYQPAAGGATVSMQFGTPASSIPFDLEADAPAGTDSPGAVGFGGQGGSSPGPAVVVPLTPDVLEALAAPASKKKAATA